MQNGEIDRGTFDKGMGVIIRESERLSGIVEELLDFSRMQSGRMTLMMDRIDIFWQNSAKPFICSVTVQKQSISFTVRRTCNVISCSGRY